MGNRQGGSMAQRQTQDGLGPMERATPFEHETTAGSSSITETKDTTYHEADCERRQRGGTFPNYTPEPCAGTYVCSICGQSFGWCHGGHSDEDSERLNGA
ncbi:unnamed protein product, partial [marine sediment metagenome]